MTLLHTFTDRIPKDRLTLFSDFISSAKPFGIVRSNNGIGVPTDVYSNGNSDDLGSVTCKLATGSSAGVYQRIGIYQTADQTGFLNKDWVLLDGEYSVECRVKTTVHPSAACIVTCGYAVNFDAAVMNGAYFYHTNGQTTWRAAVSAGSAIIRQIDTGVPVSSYQVLRVESLDGGRVFQFFANGRRVWKAVDPEVRAEIAVNPAAHPMPHVEIIDRVIGGGGRENEFVADYMMTEERFTR